MRSIALYSLIACAMLLAPRSSPCGTVLDAELDQFFNPRISSSLGFGEANVDSLFSLAQTFQVGRTGRLVAVGIAVDAKAGGREPLRVSLSRVDQQGIPRGSLATTLVSWEEAESHQGDFLLVDMSVRPIEVQTGDELAIVLETTGRGTYAWARAKFFLRENDLYRLGRPLVFDATGDQHDVHAGLDFGFQTFVIPRPIPEPKSMMLGVMMALVGAVLLQRDRSKSELRGGGKRRPNNKTPADFRLTHNPFF